MQDLLDLADEPRRTNAVEDLKTALDVIGERGPQQAATSVSAAIAKIS